jgi:hypothetical protein
LGWCPLHPRALRTESWLTHLALLLLPLGLPLLVTLLVTLLVLLL